jgi:hypothetical protein
VVCNGPPGGCRQLRDGGGIPASADRNLLFGILALQMDFVTRHALLTGMNAWVLDKHRPLGQVLVEQGGLAPEEHALVEAVVHRHVHNHGGDPQRSLAAVSSIRSVRQDLEQVADPDLQASLAQVSPARHAGTDHDLTSGYAAGSLTQATLLFLPRSTARIVRWSRSWCKLRWGEGACGSCSSPFTPPHGSLGSCRSAK